MAIKYAYQGRQASRDKNESTYKQTLYGLQSEVDTYISSLVIGNQYTNKGFLKSWHKTQKQADIWQVEVQYSTTYDFQFSDDDEQVIGKKSAQLSVRNIQMPLESRTGYRTIWNHYLFSNNQMAPIWTLQRTDVLLTPQQRQHYMWAKSLSELPTEKDANGNYWGVAAYPSKPGVQYYDMACFVVTITAKYNSASAAGTALAKNINKIVSPSEDFSLGGEWKYDAAEVVYNGKNWVATQTYTRAIDIWDRQLYDTAT